LEQFVNRAVELDQLTDCYESEAADFVVIEIQGEYLTLQGQDESDTTLHEPRSVAFLSFQSVVSTIVTS
jgi:hypothetical protein